MNKTGKSVLSVFLTLLLIALPLCAVPAFAEGAGVKADGGCGDGLTWTLTYDGVLTISGSGGMKDYYKSNVSLLGKERAPWYDYRSDIGAIVIETGVTSVGEYAFYGFSRPVTVQLPQSMELVGEYAFETDNAVSAVYYMAPVGQFGSIEIGSNNDKLLSAPRHSHVSGGGTSDTRQENQTDATCTAAGGYDAVEYCRFCNYLIRSTHYSLPALGHLYDDGVVTVPPTTTTTGVKRYTCRRDASHYFTETIPVAARVATSISDPLAGFDIPNGNAEYDHVLYITLNPYRDNYESAEHGSEKKHYNYPIDNTVYDQDGNSMGFAEAYVVERVHSGICSVLVSTDILTLVSANDYAERPSRSTFDIVQRYGDLTQTTSVIVEVSPVSDYKNFLFRDADGEPFLIYRYDYYSPEGGKALTATEPINVLQTSASIREWRNKWKDSVLTPFFREYTTGSGTEHYLINQSGILPVYPPKASDDANHYEFDHWATDAVMPRTGRTLDLNTIGEWYESFFPDYTYAIFYPVYNAAAHSFAEHTDSTPTCTTDGAGHYVCSECGREGGSYVIPATGHDYDEGKITTPATCTAEGVKTFTCRNDPSHVYTETVPATGHANASTVPESEPTATEHGHTEGVYCPDCETWLSGHEVIHNTLGERTYLDEYTEDGEQMVIIKCTVCGGEGLYAMEPVPAPEAPEDEAPLSGIQKAIRSIMDFFLRLIKWLTAFKN